MSNPNIYSTTVVNLVTLGGALTNSEVALLSNAASSGHVYKIISLYVSNISSGNGTVTASWNNGASLGGTDYHLCKTTPVITTGSLVIIDETSPVVLNENNSLGVLANASSTLEYVLVYQDIM